MLWPLLFFRGGGGSGGRGGGGGSVGGGGGGGLLCPGLPGIPEQGTQIALDGVFMTVGHVDIHTADPGDQDLRHIGPAPVTVAVAGHLIQPDSGIFFCHSFCVIIMIPKMDHNIRLHRIDAPAHEAQCGMGIRQYQDLHGGFLRIF